MVDLYHTATEYLANSLTLVRGSVDSITSVGVYHTTSPTFIPQESDFVVAELVKPGDPLARSTGIDILSLIGPDGGITLAAGSYQRWVMVKTTTETIIRKIDVVTII